MLHFLYTHRLDNSAHTFTNVQAHTLKGKPTTTVTLTVMIMIIVMMITLLLLLLAMLTALPALAVLSLLLFGYLLWRYNDLSKKSKPKQVCPVKRTVLWRQ